MLLIPGSMVQVQDSGGIVERLLGLLDIARPHVTAEAITQIAHVLRAFPDMAEVLSYLLHRLLCSWVPAAGAYAAVCTPGSTASAEREGSADAACRVLPVSSAKDQLSDAPGRFECCIVLRGAQTEATRLGLGLASTSQAWTNL